MMNWYAMIYYNHRLAGMANVNNQSNNVLYFLLIFLFLKIEQSILQINSNLTSFEYY